MESRLKERLTGAAILVALIVLIVPEIFHDRRGAQAPANPAPAVNAAPTRSYTIELGRSTAAPAAPPPAASDQVPGSALAAPPAAGPATELAGAPPAASSARSSSGGPATATDAEGRGARTAQHAQRSQLSAHTEQPEHAAHAEHTAHTGGWTVQLGLFSKQSNAEHLARSAQGHGFAVGITRFGAHGLYRVAVVGLADRAAAEELSRRLHGAGLPAAVLGPR